ncbi:MAG: hypothetical protein ABIO80_04940 [Sphingomicrobium sp.]
MVRTPAWKRYNVRVIWLSLLYVVFLMFAVYGFHHDILTRGVAYVAAVLPALPIIGMFAAIGRYLVEEDDEYIRMLMVRQTLWASAIALSLATIWGFLEAFGLAGHIDSYYVAILWFGGLGFGALINRLTMGSSAGAC